MTEADLERAAVAAPGRGDTFTEFYKDNEASIRAVLTLGWTRR